MSNRQQLIKKQAAEKANAQIVASKPPVKPIGGKRSAVQDLQSPKGKKRQKHYPEPPVKIIEKV